MPENRKMSNTGSINHTNLNSEKSENIDASSKHRRPGMICPCCRSAKMDYDGLLHLVCPNCGLTEMGTST